jgi:plastocyanin
MRQNWANPRAKLSVGWRARHLRSKVAANIRSAGVDGKETAVRNVRAVAAPAVMVVVVGVALLVGDFAGAVVPEKGKAKTVTIDNFEFSPTPLKVKSGAKVTVRNADSASHTLTADKDAFDTGEIEGGSSATVSIKKPGTYAYHCSIHDFMKGRIKAS